MVGTFSELQGKTFLICVGGMRCATSWLFHYLHSLPEVSVSPIKELHFFNAKFPNNSLSDMNVLALKRLEVHASRVGNPVDNLLYEPSFQASIDRVQMIYDDDAYLGHFARIMTPETKVLCDVTPAYAVIGQEGFAFMKRLLAKEGVDLKILYIMRDPIDRLWSQLRHMQQTNPAADVATRWLEALQSEPIMARADYQATVNDLDASFAADELLYLFYEELFTEPALGKLCSFIKADYRPGNSEERRNQTELDWEMTEEARSAILNKLSPQYAFCRGRFGDLIPAQWAA